MDLALPSWSSPGSKRGAEGSGGRAPGGKHAKTEAAEVARTKGKEGVTEIVKILTKLVLTNSRELADLTSTVYKTWEVEIKGSVVEAMAKAGADYDSESKELKKKSEAGEKVDFKARGPPYLRVWLAMLQAAAKEFEGLSKDIEGYWVNVVQKGDANSLGSHVRYCRLRKNKRKEEGEELKGHIVIAIDADTMVGQTVVEMVGNIMEAMKGKRTVGPPPRGPLERDAARLLARLQS